jgi:hypothetical protein
MHFKLRQYPLNRRRDVPFTDPVSPVDVTEMRYPLPRMGIRLSCSVPVISVRLSRQWMQYARLKRRQTSTTLQITTCQETTIFINKSFTENANMAIVILQNPFYRVSIFIKTTTFRKYIILSSSGQIINIHSVGPLV